MTRGFAYMFPQKQKSHQILQFSFPNRISPTDIAQLSKNNEAFPTFVGHPEKPDF